MKKILLTAALAFVLPLCASGQKENGGFANVVDSLISVDSSSNENNHIEIMEAYIDFLSLQSWCLDSVYDFEDVKTVVKTEFNIEDTLSNLGYTHKHKWLFDTKSKQIIHVCEVSDEEMIDAYEALIKCEMEKQKIYCEIIGKEQTNLTSCPRAKIPSFAKEAIRFVGESFAVVM